MGVPRRNRCRDKRDFLSAPHSSSEMSPNGKLEHRSARPEEAERCHSAGRHEFLSLRLFLSVFHRRTFTSSMHVYSVTAGNLKDDICFLAPDSKNIRKELVSISSGRINKNKCVQQPLFPSAPINGNVTNVDFLG